MSEGRHGRLDDDLAVSSNRADCRFGREWCADELAIDFPSIPPDVDRLRSTFTGEVSAAPLRAEVRLSAGEASDGVMVPLDVPIRAACPDCGGRGESWMEWCRACGGTGESWVRHRVRLAMPAGVPDGARFRFRVTSPLALPTRVEVLVAVG